METTRLLTLGGFAAGGASGIAGTALTGTAAARRLLPSSFQSFSDISCTENVSKDRNVFSGLEEPQRVKDGVWTYPRASAYHMPTAPSSLSGAVTGCLRLNAQKRKNHGWAKEATLEMTIFKGNYGIILLNSLTKTKEQEAWTSDYRALFLMNESSTWNIRGGIQWTDTLFSNKAGAANKKLRWSGIKINEKDLDWKSETLSSDAFSVFWKPSTDKEKNVFQELTLRADGESDPQSQDFWNGKQSPLDDNSNISSPYALFENGLWRITGDKCDVNKVRDWFNLFKDDKGTWEVQK